MDMFGKNLETFLTEKETEGYSSQWSCGDFDTKLELTDTVNDWNDNPLVINPVINYMGFQAQASGNTVKDVYFVANKLYEAASKFKGDWHYFIEAFDYNADTNSYEMITGS